MTNSRRFCSGFTLIELLIVMSIIGLLVTVLIPNLSSAQNRAKEVAVKAVAHSVQTEIEGYQIDNNCYPQGNNISLAELINVLKIKNSYTNPFTGQKYTGNDKAGQVIYSYDDYTGFYTLTCYKKDGITELLVLSNEG